MRITNQVVYAVDAMTLMAPREKLCTVQTIAETFHKSISYTEQTLAILRGAGLVRAMRGPGGGYFLNRPAEAIAISEIAAAFQPSEWTAPTPCRANRVNGPTGGKQGRALWGALGAHIYLYLDGVTLADVAAGEGENPIASERLAPVRTATATAI